MNVLDARTAAITACLVLAIQDCATAQTSDFSKKSLTIISSFGPGGGYSTYADLLARHLGKQLPGSPTVTVKNMPGAGGLNGTNYLYNVAPRDGTVLGIIPQTVAIAQAFGAAQLRYDVRLFNWIGRLNSNVEVQQSWYTSKVKKIEDAKTNSIIVAGTGPDSSSVVFPRLLNALFGMKFKVVAGYEGVNMVSVAMERGEVEGIVRPWAITKTSHPEWISQNKLNLLVQYTAQRHAELRQVPAVVDLATTEDQRQILTLYVSGSEIGRAIVAPPGVPPDVIASLRMAFTQAMHDPALLQEVQRTNLDIDPMPGQELQALVAHAVDVPPQIIAQAQRLAQ
jgi:tripartite-type tricarboxylate transporter receptor subunit TctC